MFVQKLDQESIRVNLKICTIYEGSEIRTKQHKLSTKTLGVQSGVIYLFIIIIVLIE